MVQQPLRFLMRYKSQRQVYSFVLLYATNSSSGYMRIVAGTTFGGVGHQDGDGTSVLFDRAGSVSVLSGNLLVVAENNNNDYRLVNTNGM